MDFVLTVKGSTIEEGTWILDSGSNRRLVNAVSLLKDPEEHVSECVAADVESLCITKRRSVVIASTVMERR